MIMVRETQQFRVRLTDLHLHLVSLGGPQVPSGQMDPVTHSQTINIEPPAQENKLIFLFQGSRKNNYGNSTFTKCHQVYYLQKNNVTPYVLDLQPLQVALVVQLDPLRRK